MNTFNLIKLLKKDKFTRKCFYGVLPIDRLPLRKIKRPCCFIINTDKSHQPGEHWFGIFVPKVGSIEYFDSYGRKPINEEVYSFINSNGKKFTYNNENIQSNESTNCGKFTIFYIYFRVRGFKMKQYLKFFTKNKELNDIIINKMYKKFVNRK